MKVKDAAERLMVGENAVRAMIRDGRLNAEPVSGRGRLRYEIKAESLREFKRSHEYVRGPRAGRWIVKRKRAR